MQQPIVAAVAVVVLEQATVAMAVQVELWFVG
jgi:hypothetical protein